jgi:basic membrane lipoprotein Med (substrate-binding protein (PBP1-ABC) superfamily)
MSKKNLSPLSVFFVFLLTVSLITFAVFLVFGDFLSGDKMDKFSGANNNISGGKNRKILLIVDNKITDHIETITHVVGFIESIKKYPNLGYRIVEGVEGNIELLEKIILEESKNGFNDVFLVGFDYNLSLMNLFRVFGDTKFYFYQGNAINDNVVNYLTKSYEMRYIQGIIAGISTKNNEIGVVTDFHENNQNNNLNAFALGVKSVNPSAYIYVAWNNGEKKEKAISLLNDLFAYKNIDVIIGNLAFCYWCEISEKKKIKYMSFLSNDIENNISENFIGSYKLDSKKLYDSFWKNLTNNIEFSNNEIWFGLENNIIYPLINYNSKIDNSVIQNIDETVKLLKSGNKFIFQGPIYSNQGSEIVPKDAVIDDERLETQQNWLNSNIIEFNQSKSNKFQIWNEIDLDLKIYNEEHSDRLLRRLKDILDKSI